MAGLTTTGSVIACAIKITVGRIFVVEALSSAEEIEVVGLAVAHALRLCCATAFLKKG